MDEWVAEYGPWRFDGDVLECGGYELELRDLRARPWFLVRHVSEKNWATDKVVAGLVRALVDLDVKEA